MDTTPHRYLGLPAIAGSALAAIGALILFINNLGAPGDEVANRIVDDKDRILLGGWILVLGLLLIAVFGCTLHRRILDGDSRSTLATVTVAGFVGSAIAGLSGVAAMAAAALRADESGTIAADTAAALSDLAMVMVGAMATAAMGLGIIAASLASLRTTPVVPRWLAVVGIVVAIGTFILPINYLVAPVALLWTAAAGVSLSWSPKPVVATRPAMA